jgi:hypothetical protein
MKSLALLVTLLLPVISGCESTPHYNRTKVVFLGQPSPKKPYGTVKLFQAKEEATKPYDVIALMSVSGNAGEEAAFIKAFLYRGADMGADAVIFYRVSLAGGQEGGGFLAGRNGAFGLPTHPTQDGVYRGEAIHFKE